MKGWFRPLIRTFPPVSVKLATMKKEIPALTKPVQGEQQAPTEDGSGDKLPPSSGEDQASGGDARDSNNDRNKGRGSRRGGRRDDDKTRAAASEAADKPDAEPGVTDGDAVVLSKAAQATASGEPAVSGDGAPNVAGRDESERDPTVTSSVEAERAHADGGGQAGAALPAEEVAPAPTQGSGRGTALLVGLTAVAVLASAAAGWQVYELRLATKELRVEVAQRVNGADVTVAELRGLVRQQQETIASIQGGIGAMESKVAATEGQAAALQALYQEYSRSRGDQVLAEIAQAINIAAQHLQLAGNYEAALIALESADARLAMPEQAHLQPLRKALISDLDTIKAHPRVDVSGLALKLEILLERMDKLPLVYEFTLDESTALGGKAELAEVDESLGWTDRSLAYARALAADVWDEVKGMIRLERLDQTDPVLLAPAQSTFLRENVKVRLLTARLALLARDGRTYAADLSQARGWVERFFDLRDPEVQRAVAEMSELEAISITAQPPTLEETFAALRVAQARAASAPASR